MGSFTLNGDTWKIRLVALPLAVKHEDGPAEMTLAHADLDTHSLNVSLDGALSAKAIATRVARAVAAISERVSPSASKPRRKGRGKAGKVRFSGCYVVTPSYPDHVDPQWRGRVD